jgi:hypothetical protein
MCLGYMQKYYTNLCKGLKHLQVLVSVGGARTNSLQMLSSQPIFVLMMTFNLPFFLLLRIKFFFKHSHHSALSLIIFSKGNYFYTPL